MATVDDIYQELNSIAPFDSAEEWDNVGLLVGDKTAQVKRCIIALDLTEEVFAEAKLNNVQLIVTHHPVIFDSFKQVNAGNRVYKLIKEDMHVISVHTNLDKAQDGINDVLAEKLSLSSVRSVYSLGDIGRIGNLYSTMWPDAFAEKVKEALECESLRYVSGGKPISKVGIIGGSGGNYLDAMIQVGVDAFVTADVKYAVMLQASEAGITLVDAGHYETENVICQNLCERLYEHFPDVQFSISQLWKNPIKFL